MASRVLLLTGIVRGKNFASLVVVMCVPALKVSVIDAMMQRRWFDQEI
jgi:hypothetical protein